jgi:tetratricopeptide (TPR) repeat protein
MRTIPNLALLILILPFFFSAGRSFAAATPSVEELYFEANRAYKEDRFQEAIDGYLQLVARGHINGHIYYNLGNAYFRSGRLGRAILNYKRAQLLMPRDADLNFNLRYALDQTKDAISPDQNYLKQAFFYLDDLTFGELMWGFAVLNLLFWGILGLRLFVRPEWTYYTFIVLLVFWLVGGVSLAVKWQQYTTDQRATVLAEEVDVLAGPQVNDTVLFKLHEGIIVHRERIEDGWSLIRVTENKRGWIESSAIEQIVKRD